MDEKIQEKIISAEPLFDGGFLHAQKLKVLLPNRSIALREVTRHRRAVAVVPIWSDGTVTVVTQFRPAIDRRSTEVPAGLVDAQEDLLCAAKRELKEETGISAENWYYLATVASSPGFSDEQVSLYAATGLSEGETHFDEDEFIVSQRVSLEKMHEMILSGEIMNASTITAYLLTCDKIRKGEISY